MKKSLREWQDEVGAWGDATFPQSNRATVLAHLREEVDELIQAIESHDGVTDEPIYEEAADVFLLLLHLAHKWRFSLQGAAAGKMHINRNRVWSTVAEPAGHFKHVEVNP